MKRAGFDAGPARVRREAAASTPSVPLPPPGLLARAKKLGAISAGPAMFARTAEPLAAPPNPKPPRAKGRKTAKRTGKK
jgi:hypothetical protein